MSLVDPPDRERLAELADEQSALRRIATLGARGVPAAEIFDAVAEELYALLRLDMAHVDRHEPDGSWTCVALRGGESDAIRLGRNFRWADLPGLEDVLCGRSVRVDAPRAGTEVDDVLRQERIVAWVISPIVLMGRTWGVLAVVSREGPLAAGTEERLAGFGELVATAIANAESRAELMASRARIVAAGDEARRRIQRDLHDGAQQRIVTLAIKLKMLAAPDAAPAGGTGIDFQELIADADDALDALREVSRGLHPAALSRGGLPPAIAAIARRSPIPVALDVRISGRLAESVENASYYVVAETLTNVAKHANASRIDVTAEASDGVLRVCVRDDGVGGADPAGGSGLLGLRDRVEAVGGTITVDSPPGGGTTLVAELPLGDTAVAAPEPARVARDDAARARERRRRSDP